MIPPLSALYRRIAADLMARRSNLRVPLPLQNEHELALEFSVARETIRRALRLLEEQGAITRRPGLGTYLQPNKVQSDALRGKRVGVIPPWWTEQDQGSWYYAAILDGITRWVEKNDCSLHILHADPEPVHDHAWLKRIRKLDLSGILWVQPQELQLPLLHKTAKLFPTMVLGRSMTGNGLHHTIPNYQEAAALIDRHLVEHGHRVYTVVGKNSFDPYFKVWIDCFERAHANRGSHFNRRVHFLDYGCFSQRHLATLLLDLYLTDRPEVSALVFPSSGHLHLLQADPRFCERLQTDLSLVTTNYGPYTLDALFPSMEVSHVGYNWPQMAFRAMDLLDLLAGGHPIPENTLQPVQLIPGNTVHPGPHA